MIAELQSNIDQTLMRAEAQKEKHKRMYPFAKETFVSKKRRVNSDPPPIFHSPPPPVLYDRSLSTKFAQTILKNHLGFTIQVSAIKLCSM